MFFSRIRKKAIFLCSALMFLCLSFAFALNFVSVKAIALSYLEVTPSDFTITSGNENEYTYPIIFTYKYASENLPQYADKTNTRYIIGDNVLFTANEKYKVGLQSVAKMQDKTEVIFTFYATAGDNYVAFSENITSFTIPDGFTLNLSEAYCETNPDVIHGIKFVGDSTFERGNDGAWNCVTNDETQNAPEAELDGTNEYACELQGAVTAPVWNSTQKTLSVDVSLPYTATETLVYTGTPEIRVDGAEYDGEITATQEADTDILRLTFCSAEVLSQGTGLALTISDTTLTHEKLGSLSLTGNITYYGYFGCVWSVEKLYEIVKTVGDATYSETLALTETTYQFPVLEKITGELALGWAYDEELYKAGETIPLPTDSRVVELNAVYVGFSLEEGASIRCDENGDDSGIRFTANLQEEGYAVAQAFISGLGTILLPADKLIDGVEFIYDNYDTEDEGNAQLLNVTKNEVDFGTAGLFKLYTSIVKMNPVNYNRTYCARGYLTVSYKSGQCRVWTENVEKRSIYEVAHNMLVAPREQTKLNNRQIEILESYVNGVANISYDETTGTATNICAAASPVVEGVEVSVSEIGTIKLVLTTSVTKFLAVTYNGKRVNSMGQTYDEVNRTLTVTFTQGNLEA